MRGDPKTGLIMLGRLTVEWRKEPELDHPETSTSSTSRIGGSEAAEVHGNHGCLFAGTKLEAKAGERLGPRGGGVRSIGAESNSRRHQVFQGVAARITGWHHPGKYFHTERDQNPATHRTLRLFKRKPHRLRRLSDRWAAARRVVTPQLVTLF